MAWEWVTPASTFGLGALGIVATGLTAWGGRKHAEAVASNQMTHEREMAEDARRQARLADAYVDLLAIVNRIAHFASAVRPIVDTNPPAPPPPLPTLEEQTRAEALVMAFGSREVEELFETWRQSVWAIIGADRLIGSALEMRAEGDRSGIDYHRTWRQLEEELRPAQKVARKALTEAVAVELGSRSG